MGRPATVQRPGVYQTYLFDLNETPRNSVISPGMMTSLLAGLQPRQGNDMAALTTLASLLLRGEDAFIPPNLEPVVVRPTLQQIARATRVGTPEGEHDCAICQDAITNTQQCREILHCHHWFHQDCIDPWFRQNVQCPICRFDIRQHNVVNPEDTDGEADVES